MREIKQNKKRNIKMILWFCIFSVAMFTAMLLLNKVEYGERISIVNSNEFYTNFEKWEITSNKEFAQTFSYDGKALYSFSIKYDIAEVNADAKWKIQLFTVENEKLLQEWEVESSGITSGGIQEYVLENPYNNIENMQFKIVVSMLTDGNSGVLLCGSANSSLREGEMYINNQIQEGDISILYSEVVNVKITIFYAFLLCVCFSAVICFGIWGNGFTKGIQLLKKWGQYFWTKKARLIKWCVVFLVSILLARGIEWLFIKIPWVGYHYEAHHIIRYLFWLTVCWGILIIYLQRKYLSQRPEVIVCSMLFLIGMLYIVTIQAEAEISWDESIHFWRAVGVSHASTGLANYAECYLYWHSGIPFGLPSEFESLRAIHTNIQNLYDVGVGIAANTDVLSKIYMVAYIPAAIFLKIGRGLQLPYWLVFKMGTVANLGLYVTLIYFAMCKLKSGKMILAVSASVGSALFLATVYSYDTWVIGWFVLGMAYFIGCMQKKEKLQNKELTVIILASTIAFLPKTIYFPLMLIYLLLPRNKFQDTRQYRRFFSAVLASIGLLGVGTVIGYIWILPVWIVFYFVCDISGKLFEKIGTKKRNIILGVVGIGMAVICFLVVTFVLPGILGEGDVRGGEGVNSALQVKFILQNPIEYMTIVFRFLKDYYLAFQISWKSIFTTLGYLGSTECHVYAFILLVVVCVTDKGSTDQWKGYGKVRGVNLLLSMLTICLIVTALYISFTPVGNASIGGCQPRYLIPLLYGFCATIGSCKIENKMNKTYYNLGIITVMSSILLYNIWKLVISQYL